MRKTLFILSFVAVLFISCNKPDDGGGSTPSPSPSPTPTPTESLELASGTDTNPVLTSAGGTINVKFTASVSWTASLINSNASGWVSISPSSGSAGTATIGITVKSNDSTDDRSATVQLKAGSKTANINITQKQKNALTVTKSRFDLAKEGGDISVELSSNADVTYTIEGDAAQWISYVSTKAMSSKTMTFSVAANDSVKKRSGVIRLTAGGVSERIDIYQEGETPTLVLSQNDVTIAAEGDEFVVDVTSNVDVSVSVPCDWIQLSSSKSTSTNSYRFIVSENTDTDPRAAKLVFSSEEYSLSETVAVTQKQKDALTVTSNKFEVTKDGGDISIELSTNASVSYEIEGDAANWISYVSTKAMSSKTMMFSVAANESVKKRSGVIILKAGDVSERIDIYQEGETPSLVLSQNEVTIAAEGDEFVVDVTGNVEVSYKIQCDWIQLSSSKSTSANSYRFIVSKNTDTDPRTAELVFSNEEYSLSETVIVTQKQKDALTVTSNKFEVTKDGEEISIELSTNASISYEIEGDAANWISYVSTKAMSSKTMVFSVAANESVKKRSGVIKLTAGSVSERIEVSQEGETPSLVLSQNEVSIPTDGGEFDIDVTTNADIKVSIPCKWIKKESTKSSATSTYHFVVEENTDTDSRTAEIVFSDDDCSLSEKVVVTQKQKDALTITSNKFELSKDGGEISIELATNASISYEIEGDATGWISYVTTKAMSSKTVIFNVAVNESVKQRTGFITLKAGNAQERISVVQEGETPTFTLSQKEAAFTSDGGDFVVDVTGNVDVNVSIPCNWIQMVSTKSSSTESYRFAVSENTNVDSRRAEIVFSNKDYSLSETVIVTQDQMDVLNITTDRYDVSPDGGSILIELSTNASVSCKIEGEAADWISAVTTKAAFSELLIFNVAANESFVKRTGVITLTAGKATKSIDVIQNGQTPTLVLSRNEAAIMPDGGEFTVDVTSNVDVSVTVPCDWIQMLSTKGMSESSYRFSVPAKADEGSRTAELVFYNDMYSLTEKVVVTQYTSFVHVESVSLDLLDFTITEGEEKTLNATVYPVDASNKHLIWKSSNQDVATVKDGVVKAKAPGYAYITAESEDGGYTAGCNVNVNELPKVEFWDDAFKAYCVKNFDTDGDGQISYAEAEQVTEISYSFSGNTYIYGLQAFTNLRTLKLRSDCSDLNDIWNNHYVWDIDRIYELTNLRHIELNWISLSSFDFGRLTELEYIDCSNCAFQNLDVSNLKKLAYLDCSPMAYDNLQTLTIYDGQVIPNVTVDRNSEYIPDRTVILSPGSVDGSGNEGTHEGDEI